MNVLHNEKDEKRLHYLERFHPEKRKLTNLLITVFRMSSGKIRIGLESLTKPADSSWRMPLLETQDNFIENMLIYILKFIFNHPPEAQESSQ